MNSFPCGKETIPAISRKRYCIKHKPRRPRMLSWSCKEHVTSVTLRKMIFDLLKLEVNRMVPLEEEKKENYAAGLFVERFSENLGGDEDDDDFEHPTVQQKKLLDAPSVGRYGKSLEKRGKGKNDEGASQINEELSRRLAEVEMKVVQSNTMIFECITNLEIKIQSNNFENSLKEVEERVKMNDEVMERLQILERKMDSILMDRNEKVTQRLQNLEQKVDSILTACNEKVTKHVASSSVEHGFQLLDNECELKNDVWQKVVEITDAIQVETEIEQENADVIQFDDEVTPNVSLKRQKKPAALLKSPWVNEFDSTSRTKKRVVKGTYAFLVGLGPSFAYDVDAFELWYNKGLVKKNNMWMYASII